MLSYIYKVLDNTNLMKKEGVWTGNDERKRGREIKTMEGDRKDIFVEFGLKFRSSMVFPNEFSLQ